MFFIRYCFLILILKILIWAYQVVLHCFETTKSMKSIACKIIKLATITHKKSRQCNINQKNLIDMSDILSFYEKNENKRTLLLKFPLFVVLSWELELFITNCTKRNGIIGLFRWFVLLLCLEIQDIFQKLNLMCVYCIFWCFLNQRVANWQAINHELRKSAGKFDLL